MPSLDLKKEQKEIRRLLLTLYKFFYWGWDYGVPIFGILPGRSYVDHARHHSRRRWIFQFDIQDAFPSVTLSLLRSSLGAFLEETVERVRGEVRDFLAETPVEEFRTRPPKGSARFLLRLSDVFKNREIGEIREWIIRFATWEGTLPQGAPTSPFLFYLCLKDVLKELKIMAREAYYQDGGSGFSISCYVDGFVISADRPIPPALKQGAFEVLERNGFKINRRKIREADCRQGAVRITGLTVNGSGKIGLSRKLVREWRGILHRAAMSQDPKLLKRARGLIASLKPIFDEGLPSQLRQSCALLNLPGT